MKKKKKKKKIVDNKKINHGLQFGKIGKVRERERERERTTREVFLKELLDYRLLWSM